MGEGRGESVATDKPTVVAKSPLDPIVVKDSLDNGRLANSASPDESDWSEVLSQTDYLLDQFVTSEEGPWWQRRGFSRYTKFECEIKGARVRLDR